MTRFQIIAHVRRDTPPGVCLSYQPRKPLARRIETELVADTALDAHGRATVVLTGLGYIVTSMEVTEA